MNSFVIIKISLTNLVFELIIQKDFCLQTSLVRLIYKIQKNFKLAAIYEKGLFSCFLQQYRAYVSGARCIGLFLH